MKIIEFYRRSVYGKENMYIKDNSDAFLFSRLTDKKSITRDDMENAKNLFHVEWIEVLAPQADE